MKCTSRLSRSSLDTMTGPPHLLRRLDGGCELRSTVEGVGTLAALVLLEGRGDPEAFRLGEAGDRVALRVEAQAALRLTLRGHPYVGDRRSGFRAALAHNCPPTNTPRRPQGCNRWRVYKSMFRGVSMSNAGNTRILPISTPTSVAAMFLTGGGIGMIDGYIRRYLAYCRTAGIGPPQVCAAPHRPRVSHKRQGYPSGR